MSPKKVCIDDISLAYEVYGKGKNTIIALHGHSKSPEDFRFLATEENRIISFHLFHHQHSEFPENRIFKNPLKETEFNSLFEKLLDLESVEQFHLLAYSQGGRFALKIYEYHATKVKTLSLLSPDGIDLNGFYDRAARRRVPLKMMEFFEKNPVWFLRTMRLAKVFRKIHPKVIELAEDFTQSKERMIQASRTWRNFRKIQTPPVVFGQLVLRYKTPVRIVMGRYDGIFPPAIAERFLKEAFLDLKPDVIDCGHDFFRDNTKELFRHLLPF